MRYAALTLGDKTLELFRYELADGRIDYFDAEGQSVRKALMRTPIDGARLSSTYGMREHPILGYTTMHRGIDFAAPSGTPIMAAGDGVIEKARRNGGYGKYVRIRHNSTYKTAYAHLSKYGPGIKEGQRVNQGDIIGYVGSTGRSTGPPPPLRGARRRLADQPAKRQAADRRKAQGRGIDAVRERPPSGVHRAQDPAGRNPRRPA